MKPLATVCLMLIAVSAGAATNVEERISVTGESRLALEFPFADDIKFTAWDRNEVLVQAAVTINEGRNDHIFKLESRKSSDTIYIDMVKNGWVAVEWGCRRDCRESEIHYRVYHPATMHIDAETISGDYDLDYYGRPGEFKTISGDIDLSIPGDQGVDFSVSTISGEVYSDLDIEYPQGKAGLNQVVGAHVLGRVRGGGPAVNLETISGNIYLRKK